MENLNFADKVNNAFGSGWNSNPQYGKALKEIEQVIEENNKAKEQTNVISVEELFMENSEPIIDTRDDEER